MSGTSSAGEAAALTGLLTAPISVSLHTGDPGDTGSAEVTAPSYARVTPVTFTQSGANPTIASNSSILSFPVAGEPWGTIAYFGVWSGATWMGSGALALAKAVSAGDSPRFAAGAVQISAD